MKACDHYIYITVASLACYRDGAGGLKIVAEVSTPRYASADSDALDESLRQFEAHLDRYPQDRYFVITDTQAEAYQSETVPVLSPRDLKLLLNRKLEQRYRSTDYRAVIPHRARPYAFIRNLRRRRSHSTTRILYALINPETLAPWLGALQRRALNVRGLYSLGALMPALMRQLNLPSGADALLVMRTAAGYRHAFVTPSGLRFSRLCVHSSAADSQVAQEIDKTLQYLTMARLWGVDTRHRALHISVIDAVASSRVLTVPGDNALMVQPVLIRPRDLVPNGPAQLLDTANSAWLLFNRAAIRSHGSGCASGLTLQDAGRRASYRAAALGATAAIVLASAGYAALTEVAAEESVKRGSTGELIAAHLDATAENSERLTPKADLDAEQLRAVVQTRDRLLERNIDAAGLMQGIAAALAPFPDLDIDLLEWSYAAPEAGSAPGADGAAASPPKAILIRLGGHINAHLLKADANAQVAGLASAIGRQLGGLGGIEKLPFDVAPAGILTSKSNDPAAAKPQFSVTAAIPIGPKRTS
ncbi:MAG TPA: hypothetical protein VNY80_15585 [Steroidobacteraceae bacterium]|nr:hypothetical protein [Steroidobacteraceae bacterium]